MVNAPDHTKCTSLNNQSWTTQPLTLINLQPSEYTQGFCYYPLAVNLDRCTGSYTLNDLSNRVCVSNKTEDLNLNVFNMITGINELKTLKIISHANVNVSLVVENVTQIKSGITINVHLSAKTKKEIMCAKRLYLESLYMYL